MVAAGDVITGGRDSESAKEKGKAWVPAARTWAGLDLPPDKNSCVSSTSRHLNVCLSVQIERESMLVMHIMVNSSAFGNDKVG